MFLMDSVVLAEKLDVRRDVAWSRKLKKLVSFNKSVVTHTLVGTVTPQLC